ncbi:DinB family protein [Isoalcanivorax pacificus W11-5]|uniref:DinB family protein n=1 Tax=Isoalcanivorax pacificus W11-5 TaxID=391936 RepID=A0A0B4XQT3_9GAMM|nr:DinB family protein [Isoalcanivorax pacificus]AJD49541.1 DinB family protein [Isoalcanivorax pacificus W11-5]
MTNTPSALALHDHARLMAGYNRWMNQKLYEQALTMPHAEVVAERGAFFGSIFGTLNHLCVADVIWLKRFAASAVSPLAELDAWPAPTSLTMPMADTLPALWAIRQQLDELIERWVMTLDDEVLARPLDYHNTRGLPFHKTLFFLVIHFFNHQTHHRGQVTTLLAQQGLDPGVTDLLMLIPEAS